tara:strand:+ start:1077 stop:1256 length:180 start_codon:yes stop_codon:yes gene_type:complete
MSFSHALSGNPDIKRVNVITSKIRVCQIKNEIEEKALSFPMLKNQRRIGLERRIIRILL